MKKQFILLFLLLSTTSVVKSQCDNPTESNFDLTICAGEISDPGGYFEQGVYIDTLIVNAECTIRTINLAVLNPIEVSIEECCQSIPDQPCEPGIYTQILQAANGCDSIIYLNLIEGAEDQFTTYSLCAGETFTWPDGTLIDKDTVIVTEMNDMGQCSYDSYITFLFSSATPDVITDAVICTNDTIIWNGFEYTEPGTYSQLTSDANGCAYSEILNLAAGTPGTILDTTILCEGEILDYGGFIIDETGDYNLEYFGSEACADSLLLTVTISPAETIERFGCSDDNTEPGIYVSEGESCQTIYLTVFESSPDIDTFVTICPGDSLEWNGEIFTEPVIKGITRVDDNGCNYSEVLTLEYKPDEDCTTSTANQTEALGIRIYPNPATDLLLITVLENSFSNSEIEIYDTQGQLIQQANMKNPALSMDISGLNFGLYFIKFVDQNKRIQTQSFIKL